MRAWFAGEYERCLALCDLVARRRAALVVDVCLLRARVLLRLGRAGEAAQALAQLGPLRLLDASLTARMLYGTALVRLGRINDGLAALDAARADAVAGGAQATIRSEIALARALAFYGLRDLDAAEAALREVDPGADVVAALASSYQAWIAGARGEYRAAIGHFVAALERLDTCRRYDRPLEANCLHALSTFAVERLDRSLWQFVETRAQRVNWSGSGLAEARFWIAMASCYMEELEGRNASAVRAARLAEELAPSDAYRVQARLRRAAITRLLGEFATQYDHVTSAREMFDRLDPELLVGDERNVALTLAEELAYVGAVDDARRALATYRAHPVSPLLSFKHDRRAEAYERLVEALIAEAAGDRVEAHHAYRDAFQVFRAAGYRRRALIAALRLAEISEQPYLYDYVDAEMHEFSEVSWFRRHIEHRHTIARDPIFQSLPATEREVLLLYCRGRNTEQIAEARGQTTAHVRSIVKSIYRAFGVLKRSALLVECERRGLVEPGVYGGAEQHPEPRPDERSNLTVVR